MAAVPLRLIQKPANRWIASHKRSIQRINAFLKHKEVNPNVQEAIPLVCKFPRMVRRHKSQPLFCTAFLQTHQLIFSEGSFFTPNGRMQDCTPLKEVIFQEIHSYICSGVPNKIKNIIEVLKITAYVPEFPPAEDCIHLKNGTLFLDGTLDSTARHVVRTRLPVVYNPDAPTPTKWIAFLDELLYPEDILMFQEFVGYLLLPTTLFGVMTTASRR